MKTEDRAITIEAGERVILEVRRHWLYLVGEITILVIVMFLPIFLFNVLVGFGIIDWWGSVLALYIFGAALWMLVLWIVIFVAWTNYYLDVWLITDRRLIDVEQRSLFSRHIAECRLESVEDVVVETNGILAATFDYGDIRIQTAGETPAFEISMIPKPTRIKDILSKLAGQSVIREKTSV